MKLRLEGKGLVRVWVASLLHWPGAEAVRIPRLWQSGTVAFDSLDTNHDMSTASVDVTCHGRVRHHERVERRSQLGRKRVLVKGYPFTR